MLSAQRTASAKVGHLLGPWNDVLQDLAQTEFLMSDEFLPLYQKFGEQLPSMDVEAVLQAASELQDVTLQSQVHIVDILLKTMASLASLQLYINQFPAESLHENSRVLLDSAPLKLLKLARVSRSRSDHIGTNRGSGFALCTDFFADRKSSWSIYVSLGYLRLCVGGALSCDYFVVCFGSTSRSTCELAQTPSRGWSPA